MNSTTSRYSVQWVGLGGYFNSGDLVQVGTESFYKCSLGIFGLKCPPSQYYTWYEFVHLNNGAQNLFPVNSGDDMFATINVTNQNLTLNKTTWNITIIDVNTGKKNSTIAYTPASYALSANTSIEWIDERPQICPLTTCLNGTLTNFINATFFNCSFSTNFSSHALSHLLNSSFIINLTMYTNQTIAAMSNTSIPSPLQDNGTAFKIYNFRVGPRLNASSKVVPAGGSYTIKPVTYWNATATIDTAIGGNGNYTYRYDWFEKAPGSRAFLSNAPSCGAYAGTNVCIVQTNSSTKGGTYSYVLRANDSFDKTESINSSVINVSVFAADISPLKAAMDKGFNTTITGIAAGGKKPYRYQWYAEAPNQSNLTIPGTGSLLGSGLPCVVHVDCGMSAAEANALPGHGTAFGEAQSSTAIFYTKPNYQTGTYRFMLQATDNESAPLVVNSSIANVTVFNALSVSLSASFT